MRLLQPRKLLIAATLLTSASLAQAGLISVAGGTAAVTPGSNDVLGGGVLGSLGSSLLLNAPAELTFTYLGKEAGWTNRFSASGSVGSGGFVTGTSAIGDSFSVTAYLAGLLDFSFQTNAGVVANGGNFATQAPDFFIRQLTGDSVIIALDDGGASRDADYDDLVLRIDAASVPEPATIAVLAAGLFCLGVIRRRTAPTAR